MSVRERHAEMVADAPIHWALTDVHVPLVSKEETAKQVLYHHLIIRKVEALSCLLVGHKANCTFSCLGKE